MSALSGLLARAPVYGQARPICEKAWEFGEAMVCIAEGQMNIDQLRHETKMQLDEAKNKRSELDRLVERHKLLTLEAQEELKPTSG